MPRPTTSLRAAPLLLLLVVLLTACGSAPTTPTSTGLLAQPTPTTSAIRTATPPAATYPLSWTVEAVERPALDLPAGVGREWLLVRVHVTNPGAKAVVVRERQVALTVDGATLAPDGPAIDKAERAGKGKGFGDIIGAALAAGKADTRIAVFGVPIGARQFTLVMNEEQTGTALAAPADLAALVAQAAAPATPTPAPSPTAKPPAATTITPPATAVPAPIAREPATVVEVVDGDTIKVRLANGRVDTVRYIGIDTPETKDPRTSVECFGAEAAAKNAELVGGRVVELEKDISERDRYNRLLRYVWVAGDDGNERHANEELVKWGFAAASSYPPDVRYQERFGGLQRAAQTQKIGLWGSCASAHAPLPVAAPSPSAPAASAAPIAPPAAPVQPSGGVTFTSVVGGSPNGTASVTVQTAPGASCSITYVTPAGTVSEAQGLTTRAADGNGRASWSWKIGSSTRPGTGSVTVRCGGASATAPITIR